MRFWEIIRLLKTFIISRTTSISIFLKIPETKFKTLWGVGESRKISEQYR